MKKMKNTFTISKPLSAATILSKREDQYLIRFEPGLPYDPRTKGMDHKEAFCVKVQIQNPKTHIAHKTWIICDVDASASAPNFNYIHRIGIGGQSLKTFMYRLGYKLIDQVEKSQRELAKSAKNKLTDAEYKALMNSKIKRQRYDDDEDEDDVRARSRRGDLRNFSDLRGE